MQGNPVYGNLSGNSSYPKRSQPAAMYVLLYFFSASLVILTVCGNLLVIISISHFRQLHTPTNILVLSLAVADLSIGIFGIPFAMIKTIENCWYFGEIFCLVYNLITFISTSVSISNLVFIAVDRYVAVCDPLRYTSTITVSFAGYFTALGWVFSLVYTVIIISINGIDSSEGQDGCPHDCFVILSEHAKIISNTIQDYKQGKKNISKKSERKAAKTLGIVMGVFLLCWVPYYLCGLIDSYLNFNAPPIVKNIFIWLAYFNSSVNPIIYALFYPWFQKSAKLIITLKILSPESSLVSLFSHSH
ncbi:trace amine-associated receptor 13c-like [Polypterus senegalus]|uniref:trace amine-associated receptor 13c-like n=1 Tax=Polypterus senegalus TaxID=55291 RepID=UPI0019648A21|nr:trace amine-associated receptor 13c-like [Polypterus senegalus]